MKVGLVIRIANVMVQNYLMHNSVTMPNSRMCLELGFTKQNLFENLKYKDNYRLKELQKIGITKMHIGNKVVWHLNINTFCKFLGSKKQIFA